MKTLTTEDAVADWDRRGEGESETGAMSLHIVRVLIEIREELTALRKQSEPGDWTETGIK